MRIMLGILALISISFSTFAYAGPVEDAKFEKTIRGWIIEKDVVINKAKEDQDRCKEFEFPKKGICETEWGDITARREDEKSILELWIEALKMEPKLRNFVVTTLVSPTKLKEISDKTDRMTKYVSEHFSH